MVDYDKFTIHPEMKATFASYSVTYENEKLKIVEEKGDLAELLAENLGAEKATFDSRRWKYCCCCSRTMERWFKHLQFTSGVVVV